MNIGFIGLGIMGSRMATNLLKSNHTIYVHNRSKEKAELLLTNGAIWTENPKQIAEKSDILFTMLTTPEVVMQTAFSEHGFLKHLKSNSLWIDCTTVNPAFSKEMAQQASSHNIRFLDAPVAGSLKPAEIGELIFLVGGKESDIKEIQPLLDLMGKKTIHVGSHGMGSSMKMVVNLLLGQSLVAFSEAVNFGKAMQIPDDILLGTLLNSIVVPPFITFKKENFQSDKYPTEFPLEWMQKDLQLASTTADEVEAPLESGKVANELFKKAIDAGLSREDCSAIFKFIKSKK